MNTQTNTETNAQCHAHSSGQTHAKPGGTHAKNTGTRTRGPDEKRRETPNKHTPPPLKQMRLIATTACPPKQCFLFRRPPVNRRFRELKDSHDKAMEDMENAVEAKEQAHVQEMIDLERKLLTDKGNLQKVNLS